MRARARFASLLAVVAAVASAACGGAAESPELQEFRKLAQTMRSGADAAMAKAQPILNGDATAERASWREELSRYVEAEQAIHSMLLQGRELLARAAVDRVAREPAGRVAYEDFLTEYERLADGYEQFREPYADLLEGLDAETGGEAGLGTGAEAVSAAVKARTEQLAKRSDQVLVRYLEDRAQQSRTLRIAGAKLEAYEAARKGQAFMERRGITADGAFAAVSAEIEKLTTLE